MINQKVIIVGAGFAGLYAAKELAGKDVDVTIIDRRNFHLFQPLLYQVATGGLSPGDIASPIRAIFKNAENISVINAELESIDIQNKSVQAVGKKIQFDILIIATGVHHHYFGNEQWSTDAPGLKSIEDALKIRKRIMEAFEKAELECNREKKCAWQRFVIAGAGPTGVELAGALGEMANRTLLKNFREIDPKETEIYLVEASDRILQGFSPRLSLKAEQSLKKLGVSVKTNTMVTDLDGHSVSLKNKKGDEEKIYANTVLWAAGVKASAAGQIIAQATNAETDRVGRIIVNDNLAIPGHDNIFVIGDLTHFKLSDGSTLPGVAQVAMQEGRYVAHKIVKDNKSKPFKYFDKGTMAVIGRKAAVVHFAKLEFAGWPAWMIWLFVHIAYLIGYDSKLRVMLQWAWHFFTRKSGARLITDIE